MFSVVNQYWQQLRSFSRNAQLFLVSELIIGLSFSIYMLFFNLYVVSQGYERSFLGELQSMPHLISLFGAIPAGLLVDRIGRKPALVMANIGETLGLLGIIFAPGRGLLRLSMILFGLAQSLWMVSGSPFMMENSTEKERDVLFSAHFGLQTLVGFAGTLVGGYLPTIFGRFLGTDVESPAAYGATLGVTALLWVISLIPLCMLKEQPRPAVSPNRSALPWRNVSSPGTAIRLFIPNVIISMGAAILIPYMNLFFKESFPISDKVLGAVFAGSSIVTGIATLLSPLFAKRWGRIRALVFTQLASVPFLLAIGFVPNLWVAAFAFWARAALMNMGNPLYEAFAMEQVTDQERATVSGLMGMSWNIGWTIGPFLSGYMQAHPQIGFKPIFVITCTLYAVAAVLEKMFWQKRDDRQRRALFLREMGVSDLSAGYQS